MAPQRGALIVIEGVDKTGKSTQAKKLIESLKELEIKAEYTNNPARETAIGQVIDKYLSKEINLPDQAVHLLFSANRWELVPSMMKKLEEGTTIIFDRYCYSGVAYSAAKGLDIDWCKGPDVGLPKPDKLFFFTMPMDILTKRSGFGDERYEVPEIQKKVAEKYTLLKDDSWEVLEANRPIHIVHEELLKKTLDVIQDVQNEPISKIW